MRVDFVENNKIEIMKYNKPPEINLYTGVVEEKTNKIEPKDVKDVADDKCQTCKNRTYKDGSDDAGVSFQTPQTLSPNEAYSRVSSHEQEHVRRNDAKAKAENREVVFSSVRIFSAICPECGDSYISGGETRTATAKKKEKIHFADEQFKKSLEGKLPQKIDATV